MTSAETENDLNMVDSSWRAKGKRLTQLRDLAHLERDDAAKLAGVARKTYKDWEIGAGNLSEKRAKWIVDELQARGVQCSVEWVLTGVGAEPQRQRQIWEQNVIVSDATQTNNHVPKDAEVERHIVMGELDYFCSKHRNSIGLVISDEAMMPMYSQDDVVAGIQRTKADIASLIGIDCIVKFVNGTVLLRNLNKGRVPDLFTLICSNQQVEIKILFDQELVSAAPVLWHRRLDKW